jgi:hypothetical protein
MAIAKKPNSHQTETNGQKMEQAAEAFISGAGTGQARGGAQKRAKKIPIMMRFDPEVLAKVDAAAKRRGIGRSAWIQFTVSRALDQGEG